jgi:hypothetical protein
MLVNQFPTACTALTYQGVLDGARKVLLIRGQMWGCSQPSGDVQRRAGDVGSVLGQQPQYGRGDFLGGAHPGQRNLAERPIQVFFGLAEARFGGDDAGP